MGGVDLSDQMVTSYICLMKGSVWYHKIFFFLLDLSISNAQILMAKSFRDAPKMLQLRKAVLEQLVDGKTFRLTDRNPESTAPIPHFHLNQDYFHYPISNSNRLACKLTSICFLAANSMYSLLKYIFFLNSEKSR